MNPQTQSIPREHIYAMTVDDLDGGAVEVSVRSAQAVPVVFIREYPDDHGNTFSPHNATRLAQVLLEAAESTGDPVASRILRALRENVARHKEARQLAEARDDDTDPDVWNCAEQRRLAAWERVGNDPWDTHR